METHKHNVKFKVSLSNGETFFEGKPPFDEIPNELSPWNKLQEYIFKNKVEVTSLSLYTDSGQTFNLPSAGKNPKFKVFQKLEKPLDFQCFRAIGRDLDVIPKDNKFEATQSGDSDWFTIAEAIYSSYRLQIWVDEQNPRNSWVLVC